MKNFFRSIGVFIKAMPHFLAFEMLYKILLVSIGAPALTLLLNLTMKAAGIKYLSDESLMIYIKHPLTLLTLLVLLFAVAVFSFIELTGLTGCFACYAKGEKLSVGGMFRTGFRAFGKAFRGAGILNFLLYMSLIPLAQFTLSSGVFLAPLMPLLRMICTKLNVTVEAASVFYIFLQLLFLVIISGACYSLHYLVLTKNRFRDCVKKSRRAVSGKMILMVFSLALWSFFILAVIALITFGLSFLIVFFIKGFGRADAAFRTSLKVLRYAVSVFGAVSAFFTAPGVMCWLTGKFLTGPGADEEITLPEREPKKMNRALKTAMIVCLTAAGAAANVYFVRQIYKGNIRLNTGILGTTQVSAHRGSSRKAPENTLYAFEAALDSGADYIELDIQLTKDDQLVVIHDDTLDRTTDGKGKVNSYTYAELQRFSAGSWYGKTGEFADAKIPLLTEVLDLVGSDILLNLEIKDAGNTLLTAELLVETIEEYDISDSCYVTSFSYPALKKVKQLDPGIKTAMIANLATSTAFSQLKDIDAVSMNYVFVNQSIVNTVHYNGKSIFVWTVDRQADMKQLMAMGVDNIITNRPERAAEVVASRSVGDTILRMLEYIFS